MTNSEKLNRNLQNFDKALSQLKKALEEPESPIVRDATIQRFEFTYELCWKTLKNYLEDIHGIRAVSPRMVFKEAFAIDLIENEEIFIEMIESRNRLSHTYNEEQAQSIYLKCDAYLKEMKMVTQKLKTPS
ncbi:MAG: nucleotidyltransferase [Desulfobacula sp.]|jgi:nucleotidyltransferase substrate binding protein (TIGR01987 family)|uniref:nucleotidyltransferase substrate binding protein n=1 Tax=Desulfobacula sp. TaxID=2593537 RepID=UPI001D3191D1|nr:nucleotidyltransferase [Desulfobacula sp.]MBT3487698.1 nucleotidyltransferase [Desulfobacula sp.]MBT3807277.1 nucleotidyltransferase [Desulfobacula sp.]MBT4027012.1 nucleotidyltransferase [Desulfobacula sp.]MBT4200572.1 nucleotidyltransferase [Desulfobacula sp.]